MEEGIFVTDPAVAGTLSKHFVESRLDSVARTDYPKNVINPLRARYIDKNPAMGIYVAIDPVTEEPLARLFGTHQKLFLPFLEEALAKRR